MEFTQFLANHNEDFFPQLLRTKEKPGCGNCGCTCRWKFSSFGNAALESPQTSKLPKPDTAAHPQDLNNAKKIHMKLKSGQQIKEGA